MRVYFPQGQQLRCVEVDADSRHEAFVVPRTEIESSPTFAGALNSSLFAVLDGGKPLQKRQHHG
jgi:hypothetical protein